MGLNEPLRSSASISALPTDPDAPRTTAAFVFDMKCLSITMRERRENPAPSARSMTMAPTRATFLFNARDQPGLVARLAGFFYELALNIVDGSDHVEAGDVASARFFIRMVVELDDSRLARA